VIATSAAQEHATAHGAPDGDALPPLEQVRDRVWALATAMPGGLRRLDYTLTYLLVDDDGRVHVVDPGSDTDDNWRLLLAAVAEVSPDGDVGSVIVTHLHPDHLGLARRLREATGAPLVLHEREAVTLAAGPPVAVVDPAVWGVPTERRAELAFLAQAFADHRPLAPDLTVRGVTDHLRPAGLDIEVLHTPGHTAGHVCLRLPAEKLLLTGDHVLPALYPGLGLGGTGPGVSNPIADNVASTARLRPYDDHEVLPGHHYRFTGLVERLDAIDGHHRRRSAEVAEILRSEPGASVYEVAAGLTWSRGWQGLRGGLLYSALLQTSFHIDFLRHSATTGHATPGTLGDLRR